MRPYVPIYQHLYLFISIYRRASCKTRRLAECISTITTIIHKYLFIFIGALWWCCVLFIHFTYIIDTNKQICTILLNCTVHTHTHTFEKHRMHSVRDADVCLAWLLLARECNSLLLAFAFSLSLSLSSLWFRLLMKWWKAARDMNENRFLRPATYSNLGSVQTCRMMRDPDRTIRHTLTFLHIYIY